MRVLNDKAVKITGRDGKPLALVELFYSHNGLAVTAFQPSVGFEEFASWFVITQIDSGDSLHRRFPKLESAKNALDRLLALADWTNTEALKKDVTLRGKVMAIQEAEGGI